MKLENYEVHLPSYSIGDHIYDKIGPVCESYGKTVLLIGGRRALKAAEGKIRTYVAKTNLEIIGVELYGSDIGVVQAEQGAGGPRQSGGGGPGLPAGHGGRPGGRPPAAGGRERPYPHRGHEPALRAQADALVPAPAGGCGHPPLRVGV